MTKTSCQKEQGATLSRLALKDLLLLIQKKFNIYHPDIEIVSTKQILLINEENGLVG